MSSQHNNDTAITVKQLTKKFGDFIAVDQIEFNVPRGVIFGFLGPNGSGKTTTIRMMLGLLKPSQGEVWVLGHSVTHQPEYIRPRVGYMSQRFTLYNDLTVWQNLQFYGKVYGLKDRQLKRRIQFVLELSGLLGREVTPTKYLSGGWRQRLALGASIIHEPELIFLDEPTAGVDPLSRRAFWDLLYRLVAEGVTILVTTHYMDEAEHCHELAFLQHGRIIAQGTPESLKQRVLHGSLLEVYCSDNTKVIEILNQVKTEHRLPIQEISLYGALVHARLLPARDFSFKKVEKEILSRCHSVGLMGVKIAEIEPTLEDVFIASMNS